MTDNAELLAPDREALKARIVAALTYQSDNDLTDELSHIGEHRHDYAEFGEPVPGEIVHSFELEGLIDLDNLAHFILVGEAPPKAPTPEIITRVASGDWPAELSGLELQQVLVLIDKGMDKADCFDIAWAEARNAGEVDVTYTSFAHLVQVELGHFAEPELGVADPEIVADYAKVPPEDMPPIIITNGALKDGNHRIAAARIKARTKLQAYLVTDRWLAGQGGKC